MTSDTKNQIIKLARLLLQIENKFIELSNENEAVDFGKIIEINGEKRVELDELGVKLFILGQEAFSLTRMIKTFMVLTESLDIEDEEVKSALTQLKDRTWLNSSFYFVAFINKHSEQLGIGPVGKRLIEMAYKPDVDIFNGMDRSKMDDLFSVESFTKAKFHFPPLITSSQVPSLALRYFEELRDLCAHTHYSTPIAFYSLCRSIIEICLKDRLMKQIKTMKVLNFDLIKDDGLKNLIDKAEDIKILNKKYAGFAHTIRKEANKIIHPKYHLQDISTDNAIKVLKNTVEVIEFLYS